MHIRWYRQASLFECVGERFSTALSKVSSNGLVITLAALIGLGAGFTSVGFAFMLRFSQKLFASAHTYLSSPDPWLSYLLPIVPAVGGLIAGPIIFHFAREAKGHGVPEVMDAVASHGGILRRRVVFIKALASAVTIGSGGSAGQEGPIVQIGSALGSTFGRALHMSTDRMKVLVGCGAAGGIAAIFNAPIAGVLFSLEIILGDFRVQTFSPIVVSSVLASVVARTFLGRQPAFSVPPYELIAPWELANYVVLGALCGCAAVGFMLALYGTEDRFDQLRAPEWVKPAIGGLLTGCLAILNPDVLGGGYPPIGRALHGAMPIVALALLVVLKPLATSFTLGSGGSGGVFSPSLFLGAMVGGLFGHGVGALFPDLAARAGGMGALSGAYALVGMSAVVGAATHAWLTSAVIVFEMTGDYNSILPIMLGTVASMLVARALNRESIYTMKLARMGRRVQRGLDLALLERLHVSDAMFRDYVYLRPESLLPEVLDTARRARSYDFPVVAEDGRLMGMISLPDAALAREAEVPDLIIAADLASSRYAPLYPNETLASAMSKFDFYDRPTLPVVSREDPGKIVGMLDRRQILNLHERVSLLGQPNGAARTSGPQAAP